MENIKYRLNRRVFLELAKLDTQIETALWIKYAQMKSSSALLLFNQISMQLYYNLEMLHYYEKNL